MSRVAMLKAKSLIKNLRAMRGTHLCVSLLVERPIQGSNASKRRSRPKRWSQKRSLRTASAMFQVIESSIIDSL
jgi:hypothetical protein